MLTLFFSSLSKHQEVSENLVFKGAICENVIKLTRKQKETQEKRKYPFKTEIIGHFEKIGETCSNF